MGKIKRPFTSQYSTNGAVIWFSETSVQRVLNNRYDNLLDILQLEALNHLNGELASKILGGALPVDVKNLLPKLK